jgi:hypothetical protein
VERLGIGKNLRTRKTSLGRQSQFYFYQTSQSSPYDGLGEVPVAERRRFANSTLFHVWQLPMSVVTGATSAAQKRCTPFKKVDLIATAKDNLCSVISGSLCLPSRHSTTRRRNRGYRTVRRRPLDKSTLWIGPAPVGLEA